MTKQTVKKKICAKALAPLIAGLLLISIFALALISGLGLNGSLFTPATARAAQSDYWDTETLCADYINGEYNAFDVTVTKEGDAYYLTAPRVTADDVSGYNFSEFYLCVKNPAGIKSHTYVTEPDKIAPFLSGAVKLNLAEFFTFGDMGVYSFYVIYGYFSYFPMGIGRLSNIATFQYSTSKPLPPDPTKEGYTFTGWYLDEACTEKYTGQTVTGDITLYAGWQINRYTVTFDTAGGLPVSAQTVDWNTAATLTTPERTGYDFLGWFLPDGTAYENQPVKADTTLTAKWQIKTLTVTFYVDGKVYKTLTVDYGTTLSDAMDAAEVQNYYAFNQTDASRVSKFSMITDSTGLALQELSGWEKFGDFIAQNNWLVWVAVGLVGALVIALTAAIIIAKKKG